MIDDAIDGECATGPDEGGEASAHDAEETPSTSSIADGIEYLLDPASVIVERFTRLIRAGVSNGLLWFMALFVATFDVLPSALETLVFTTLPLVTVLWICWSIWWPKVSYPYSRYRTDEKGITIRRGVLWRRVTSIPKARVQHTDVNQGPLERRYGLAHLIIYTAGTQHAFVSLGGLPHDKASTIRDYLVDGNERDGV